MSLSQKHSGKVLVPWFNIAEWKTVYELIYSENNQNWPKALEILKIWKTRLPLLSSGVEGTLIILEALLINTEKLTDYEIANIFSTALVRFLNLCAANSDKQGTFYKAAKKNELPQWLVSLRHDIAHSHKIPSVFMLELSLKFCFNWVKEKYWEVQPEFMVNLTVEERNRELIEDVVYSYVYLNHQLLYKPDLKYVIGELKARINKFINNNNQKIRNNKEVLKTIEDKLREVMVGCSEVTANYACTLLVDDYLILSVNHILNDNGKKRIPIDFRNNWSDLMNLLYETGTLLNLLHKLFDFTCSRGNDFARSEVASLWIYEIFLGLLNREESSEDILKFNSVNKHFHNGYNFMEIVLNNPNIYSLNYLNEILIFNDMSKEFIEDTIKLVTAAVRPALAVYSNTILTINDLDIGLLNSVNGIEDSTTNYSSSEGWRLVKDTSVFENCPLGILPHQSRDKNPVLCI